MNNRFSRKDKQLICEEFSTSRQTMQDYCKKKQIGLSTLNRWMRELGYKRNKNKKSSLARVKIDTPTNLALNPIQMILSNGIKINLPPNFCKDSLKIILTSAGEF